MKPTMTSKSMQLLLLALVAGSALSANITGSFEKGVPDSGYGCANECNDADVNYVIRASLKTYTIKGANNAPGFPDGEMVKTFTRTFEGVESESSPFCNEGDDGTTGPLAPCLTVNPGQTLKIKVMNDMENGMTLLKQNMTKMAILQAYANQTGVATVNGTGLGGTGLNSISEDNMPGYDETFDVVNLHLHGLQVIPHLFYPQGTGDPTADWITITPPNENTTTQCFCYVFDIPDDHPMGTFFWHIHRHGSTAMQSWAGMAGMVQVGNSSTPGSPERELEAQGVNRRHPMVLWEWAIDTSNVVSDGDSNNTYFEGAFPVDFSVPTRQITMLNNNEYQPTLEMEVNETIHVPLLCAQMSTGEFEKSQNPGRQRCATL
jgi:FtsP/CotA-like multicopper oxidase with cupredoxin domain